MYSCPVHRHLLGFSAGGSRGPREGLTGGAKDRGKAQLSPFPCPIAPLKAVSHDISRRKKAAPGYEVDCMDCIFFHYLIDLFFFVNSLHW